MVVVVASCLALSSSSYVRQIAVYGGSWYLQLMALSHISNLVMRKKSRQAREISGAQRTAYGIVDNLWITYKFFDFI
jgi:arginine exporter protein ArgO